MQSKNITVLVKITRDREREREREREIDGGINASSEEIANEGGKPSTLGKPLIAQLKSASDTVGRALPKNLKTYLSLVFQNLLHHGLCDTRLAEACLRSSKTL